MYISKISSLMKQIINKLIKLMFDNITTTTMATITTTTGNSNNSRSNSFRITKESIKAEE